MRLLGILGCLMLLAGSAEAATYHVAKTGSNATSCANSDYSMASRAKLTLTGTTGALSCIAAGDTILVHAGSYDEGISTMTSGTSWVNKVRIAAYPDGCASTCDSVTMAPSTHGGGSVSAGTGNPGSVVRFTTAHRYIEFDGINMDGSHMGFGAISFVTTAGNEIHHIRVKYADIQAWTGDNSGVSSGAAMPIEIFGSLSTAQGGYEFQHLTLHGGGRHITNDFNDNAYGIYLAAPNSLVEYCTIYDTQGAGLHIYNDDGTQVNNNIIRNNVIRNLSRNSNIGQLWGIINYGPNAQIYNNVVYDINSAVGYAGAGQGIVVATPANGTSVWNNTIYNIETDGIHIGSSVTSAVVQNNISYNTATDLHDEGTGTTKDHNLCTTGCNINGTASNTFNNAAGGDFTLKSGAPARTACVNLYSTFTTDMAGAARPTSPTLWDCGAYQFAGSGTVSPDCTRVPPTSAAVNASGDSFTLGSGSTPNIQILRNGVQVGSTTGSEIEYYNGNIYAKLNTGLWATWNGSTFSGSSASDPSGTACGSAPVFVRLIPRWWTR